MAPELHHPHDRFFKETFSRPETFGRPQVAFQLLRFMVRIWELHQRLGTGFAPILPMVFYHGRTRWELDNRFDALFPGPEVMRPYWPSFHSSSLTSPATVTSSCEAMNLYALQATSIDEFLAQLEQI